MTDNDIYNFNLVSFISNLLTLIILIALLVSLYLIFRSVQNPLEKFFNYVMKNIDKINDINSKVDMLLAINTKNNNKKQ